MNFATAPLGLQRAIKSNKARERKKDDSPEILLICGQLEAHFGQAKGEKANMGKLAMLPWPCGKLATWQHGLCYLVKMHLASNSSQLDQNFQPITKIAMWTWSSWQSGIGSRVNKKKKKNLGQNTRANRHKPIFQTIDSDLKRVLKHARGLYEGPIHHGQGNL
jgi:hypothetical protein